MCKENGRSLVRVLLLLGLVVLPSEAPLVAAPEAEYPTLPADGVPYHFEAKERIVAIGDIHGNFDGMVTILKERQLVDEDGHWIGGKAHVVFMGDLNGKGDDTRLVLDFIIRLTEQARTSGGMVHALIGNHEARHVTGDLSTTTTGEVSEFYDFKHTERVDVLKEKAKFKGVKRKEIAFVAAVQGDSKYAKWFRERNQYVRIGNPETGYFGFVHAGARRWMAGREGEINATTRRWIEYYQGVGPKPPKATRWTIASADSPSWDRRLTRNDLKKQHVDDIVEGLGIKLLVVGHKPTESGKIEKLYGGKVVLTDTGIHAESNVESLAAVEIREGALEVVDGIQRRVEARARAEELDRRSLCANLGWEALQ